MNRLEFLAILLLMISVVWLCHDVKNLSGNLNFLQQENTQLKIKIEMLGVRSYFIDMPDKISVYREYREKWEKDMEKMEKLRVGK